MIKQNLKNTNDKAQIRISIEIDLPTIVVDPNTDPTKTERREFSPIRPRDGRRQVTF